MEMHLTDLEVEKKKQLISAWLSLVMHEADGGNLKIVLRGMLFEKYVLIIDIREAVKAAPPGMLMNSDHRYVKDLLWEYGLLVEHSISIRNKAGVWRHGTAISMPHLLEFIDAHEPAD